MSKSDKTDQVHFYVHFSTTPIKFYRVFGILFEPFLPIWIGTKNFIGTFLGLQPLRAVITLYNGFLPACNVSEHVGGGVETARQSEPRCLYPPAPHHYTG